MFFIQQIVDFLLQEKLSTCTLILEVKLDGKGIPDLF